VSEAGRSAPATIVDSSGWLEFFAGGKNAAAFEPPLLRPDALIVPAVTIYEVFKVLCREAGEEAALQGVAAMQQGRVIELTPSRALAAAAISVRHGLPMADSMIVAAAGSVFTTALRWSHARMSVSTFAPSTPVSLASRPWNFTLKPAWSMPKQWSMVACMSWTVQTLSTAA